MVDPMPLIPLTYTVRRLDAHDGHRYIGLAWNAHQGVFLVAPEFPNARYNEEGALTALAAVAAERGCRLYERNPPGAVL